jgi:hypothetical protein
MADSMKKRKEEAARNKVEQKFDGGDITGGNMGSEKLSETYSDRQKAEQGFEKGRDEPAQRVEEPEGVSRPRNTERSDFEKERESREGRNVARTSRDMDVHEELDRTPSGKENG